MVAGVRFLGTPVNIAPGTAGSFQVVDVSAHTEADDTGAIIHFINTGSNGSAHAQHGDSTDTIFLPPCNDHSYVLGGLDADDNIQIYISSTSIECWLIGFTGSAWSYEVDGVDIGGAVNASPGNAATVDLSTILTGSPSDIVLFYAGGNSSSSRTGGFWHPDSAETLMARSDWMKFCTAKGGTDIAAQRSSSPYRMYGFATMNSAAPFVASTDATQVTPASASTLGDHTIHADAVATLGNVIIPGTTNVQFTVGPKGAISGTQYDPTAEGAGDDYMRGTVWFVETDGDGKIQNKGDTATTDKYEHWGYFTAEGGGGPTLKAASDALDFSVTETRSLLASVDRSDTLSLTLGEIAAIGVTVDVAETLTVNLADAAGVQVSIGAADGVDLSLTETPAIVVAIAAGDAVDLSLSDAVSILSALTRSDDLNVGLADARTIFAQLTGGDGLDLSLGEAGDLVNALSAGDTIAVSLLEAGVPLATLIAKGLVALSDAAAYAVAIEDKTAKGVTVSDRAAGTLTPSDG